MKQNSPEARITASYNEDLPCLNIETKNNFYQFTGQSGVIDLGDSRLNQKRMTEPIYPEQLDLLRNNEVVATEGGLISITSKTTMKREDEENCIN